MRIADLRLLKRPDKWEAGGQLKERIEKDAFGSEFFMATESDPCMGVESRAWWMSSLPSWLAGHHLQSFGVVDKVICSKKDRLPSSNSVLPSSHVY